VSRRPLHVAQASWRQVSLEIRTIAFSRPVPKAELSRAEKLAKLAVEEVTISEEVSRVTIVSGKWKFKS
jgi:hypothetical protein